MASDGSLSFNTEIDTKGFGNGIKKLGGLASSGLSVVGGAVSGVVGAIAGASTALVAGAAAGVKYNASIEAYQTSFEVMTGSAEKAEQIMKDLQELGASTPFELSDLANSTQLLMAFGLSADEAKSKMMQFGDIAQGDAQKLETISRAYGKMSSAGKVSLEDINMMIDTGFNPLQEITETTGESMTSLRDRISDGTMSVQEITDAMSRSTAEGGKYFESMQKQSMTFNGLVSTLKDNAQQLIGSVVEPLSASLISTLLPSAIEAMTGLTTAFQEEGVDGLISAGSDILTNIITGIAEKAPELINTAVTVISTLLDSINNNSTLLGESGGKILMALANGISILLPKLIVTGVTLLTSLLKGIGDNLGNIKGTSGDTVVKFIDYLTENLPAIVSMGIDILLKLLNGIANALPEIVPAVARLILAITGAIVKKLPDIIAAGVNIVKKLWIGLDNAEMLVKEKAKTIIDGILTKISDKASSIVASGKAIIVSLISGIGAKAGELAGKATSLITSFKTAFTDINWSTVGTNIINGIKTGIINATSGLVQTVKDAAEKAVAGVKNFLGIKSPSRLLRDEVGVFMAQGIGVGFEKDMPSVTEDMINSTDNSVNDMIKSASTRLGSINLGVNQSYQYESNNVDTGTTPVIIENHVSATVELDKKEVGIMLAPIITQELAYI